MSDADSRIMQTQRRPNGPNCSSTRSKVSNGTLLLANIDGRSSTARRFRDLVRSFEADHGGTIGEADRSLVRQAATLLLKSEQLQSAVVRGEEVDSDALIRLASTSKRVLSSISAKADKRRSKPPSLADHIRHRAQSVT